MKPLRKWLCAALVAALSFTLFGCVMTVDQMYVPPRRSESYKNLQAVMDEYMDDLDYCAPITGENQQSVQMADLTGDGLKEVVVFVKGSDEHPLKVMIFKLEGENYAPVCFLEFTGTAFDQVEYIQLDGEPGLEMVVGRQVSDQVMRNVTVYDFDGGQPEQLLTVNYQKFLTLDMNKDGRGDLFVLCPGRTDTDCGIVELYSAPKGTVEKSAEVSLSQPVGQLKRIMTGSLHDGERAVFVASVVDAETIVTDVYALVNGALTKRSANLERSGEREHLIRWYALGADGSEHDKCYTYHNYLHGWYMELEKKLVNRLCVVPEDTGRYAFCLWDPGFENLEKLWSIYVLTGEDRSNVAVENGRFVLIKTDTVVYAAYLEDAALKLGFTQESLTNSFFLIQSDWKTGEM